MPHSTRRCSGRATHYVEVRGYGRLNAKDEWTSILVKQVNATRSWAEPFDLDSFLEDPNPKIFDPEQDCHGQ